ncbi:MAG: prepilin-type N-terminal cleavage/methylation domain-containing protein [bacterium]|nr:prepilin-type N-terminal cleavage/methylation domain-containing protein [bacterium]
MKLLAVSTNKSLGLRLRSGFTLIEILVVLGIVGMVLAIGSMVNFDTYGREILTSEHSSLASVLYKARGMSMNNLYSMPHGVHVEPDSYVIFRGSPYSFTNSNNEVLPRNPNIIITPADFEVTFAQLSGEPSATGALTMSDGTRTKTVTIISGGLIDW